MWSTWRSCLNASRSTCVTFRTSLRAPGPRSESTRLCRRSGRQGQTARCQSTRLPPSASGIARPRRWRSYVERGSASGPSATARPTRCSGSRWSLTTTGAWRSPGAGVVVSCWAYVGEAEHHEQALVQFVRPLHGVLECVVLFGTLGGLHPVQDVVPFPHIRLVQVLYALSLYLPRRHSVLPSRVLVSKQAYRRSALLDGSDNTKTPPAKRQEASLHPGLYPGLVAGSKRSAPELMQ